MTEKPILYVRAGKTPANWRELEVRRVHGGRVIPDVVEADAFNGWFVQAIRDKKGKVDRAPGGAMRTRRVQAKIKIGRREA